MTREGPVADEGTLALRVPRLDELWYRERLLADPETMRYNRGYRLDFPGYHDDTGCIDFPRDQWERWHTWFCQGKPERYYAYVVRADGAFLGEVNLHRNVSGDWYDMGIVLEAVHRGCGYAAEALRLLLKEAFDRLGAKEVRNDFERDRVSALKAHLSAGFAIIGEENGIVRVRIAKKEFERENRIFMHYRKSSPLSRAAFAYKR